MLGIGRSDFGCQCFHCVILPDNFRQGARLYHIHDRFRQTDFIQSFQLFHFMPALCCFHIVFVFFQKFALHFIHIFFMLFFQAFRNLPLQTLLHRPACQEFRQTIFQPVKNSRNFSLLRFFGILPALKKQPLNPQKAFLQIFMMNIFQCAIAACADNQFFRTNSAGIDFINHIQTPFQFRFIRCAAADNAFLQTIH